MPTHTETHLLKKITVKATMSFVKITISLFNGEERTLKLSSDAVSSSYSPNLFILSQTQAFIADTKFGLVNDKVETMKKEN